MSVSSHRTVLQRLREQQSKAERSMLHIYNEKLLGITVVVRDTNWCSYSMQKLLKNKYRVQAILWKKAALPCAWSHLLAMRVAASSALSTRAREGEVRGVLSKRSRYNKTYLMTR